MRSHLFKIASVSLAALIVASACDKKADVAASPAPAADVAAPVIVAPDYAALLLAADRPMADAGRDANRKPAEILAFSKIMPGQTVFEIEAGGGYYTELLSHAVGPGGKVTMQAPKEFEAFYKKDVDARLAANRLPNVTLSQTLFDKLEAPDASVDVVTWFQGPHELYFKPDNIPAGTGDPVKSYAEVFRILKPGGYFIIMDHAAKAGEPATTGNTLHRIDPMLVKAAATTAGFVSDGESTLLANPADDHAKGVFDPAIQGKTDQFLLRYQKPS
jgi:predicted methyltransferase